MSYYQNDLALERRARIKAEAALNKVSEALKLEKLNRKELLFRLRKALLEAAKEVNTNGVPTLSFADLRRILDRYLPVNGARDQKSENEQKPFHPEE